MQKSIPLARKLATYVALSEAELNLLNKWHQRRRTLKAEQDIIHQGERRQSAYIVASGWACSCKLLPNGSRQIVDFQIPGDFLGLRSILFGSADHNVEAVTDIEVSEVLMSELVDAFSHTPRLATAVLWAASRDEAIVVEHLIDVGRRDAVERIAHFLLELGFRMMLTGLGTMKGYPCPLSQRLLADVLGLTSIHVNRVLRQLRQDGLLTFRAGTVSFDDFDRLMELAQFDKAYLDYGPLLR